MGQSVDLINSIVKAWTLLSLLHNLLIFWGFENLDDSLQKQLMNALYTGAGQKLRTGSLVLPVADSIFK